MDYQVSKTGEAKYLLKILLTFFAFPKLGLDALDTKSHANNRFSLGIPSRESWYSVFTFKVGLVLSECHPF